MNEPTEVLVGRSVRPYDNLDRRMACTPQDQWTPEMEARIKSDQQQYASQQRRIETAGREGHGQP